MTPAVAAAVEIFLESGSGQYKALDAEPSLEAPAAGHPISHGQLIDISRYLKQHPEKVAGYKLVVPVHLNELLRGCTIYVPPPRRKPEKSDEYKALMARLRVEEESRQYLRMLQAPSETFAQHFPTLGTAHGHLFQPPQASQAEDEMTYADINRQMALIANVLISIVACSICVWKAAWHWDVPARLALSMSSSVLVAVAEVAIYMGYIGRLQEAKGKERRVVERKEVSESWVIEAKSGKEKRTGDVSRMVEEIPVRGLRMRTGRKGP